jgi:hypothetical protein
VFLVSAALVVVAIVLLLLGMITGTLTLVYFAIGVSVVSMILLALGIFLQRELWTRRRNRTADADEPEAELEPVGAASAARPATKAAAPGSSAARSRDAGNAGPASRVGSAIAAVRRSRAGDSAGADPDEMPAEDFVHVVPGRRRYHRKSCRSLVGRVSEELTIDEAREEGFSACTGCFPVEAEPKAGLAAAEVPDQVTAAPGTGPLAGAGETSVAGTRFGDAPAETAAETAGESAGAAGETAAVEELATPAQGIAADAPAGQSAAQAEGPEVTRPAAVTVSGNGSGPGTPTSGSTETVWVVRGVSRYHSSDCVLIRSVDEDDVDTMSQAEAEATGCTPCLACHTVD